VLMLVIVAYMIYRTYAIHKKVKQEKEEEANDVDTISDENIAEKSTRTIVKNLKTIVSEYGRTIDGLEKENVKELRKAKKDIDKITAKTKYMKDHINVIVEKLREDSMDTAYYFVQVLDYLREMLHSISFILGPALNHVDNNHKPLIKEQIDELRQLHSSLAEMVSLIANSMESGDYSKQEELQEMQKNILELIAAMNRNMIKRLKKAEVGTKNSILFFNILNETKNLALQAVNLYKSQRDFVNYKNGYSS